MTTKYTSGPWRWEFNEKHKQVHLVGGVPQYDLTIMDFTRWGMGGAGIELRDTADEGMNTMHKLHERPDWIEAFEGRKHHQSWCANVIHPDMRLIAAAPELLEALQELILGYKNTKNTGLMDIQVIGQDIINAAAAIAKATGEQE